MGKLQAKKVDYLTHFVQLDAILLKHEEFAVCVAKLAV